MITALHLESRELTIEELQQVAGGCATGQVAIVGPEYRPTESIKADGLAASGLLPYIERR